MNSNEPANILTLVIEIAETIVKLNELWKKIEPDAKRIIESLVEASKKLSLKSNVSTAIKNNGKWKGEV